MVPPNDPATTAYDCVADAVPGRVRLAFTGTSPRTIDAKWRVVLPAAAARAISEAGGVSYVMPGRRGVGVEVIPEHAFEETVLQPSRSTVDLEEALRLDAMIAAAERVEMRGPGRVTIPPGYRSMFEGGSVLVIGRDSYLEIVGVGAEEI